MPWCLEESGHLKLHRQKCCMQWNVLLVVQNLTKGAPVRIWGAYNSITGARNVLRGNENGLSIRTRIRAIQSEKRVTRMY